MKEFKYYKELMEYLKNENAPRGPLSYFLKKSLETGKEKPQEKQQNGAHCKPLWVNSSSKTDFQ